jgi:hypothetical protein
MLFAVISYNGKEQLCCVDKIGRRAFLTNGFFDSDLKELAISSNCIEMIPETMEQLVGSFDPEWSDDMALFFGSNPDLGIELDPESDWSPLVRLEEIWSPLEETRGRGLLE